MSKFTSIATQILTHSYSLLDSLSRTVRRGTFQGVGAANISKLIGTMWGLIIETVDPNCALEVKIDGKIVLNKTEIILRVCDPVITSRIFIKGVPPGSKEIEAILFVGDETKHNSLVLSEQDNPSINEVCAIEVIVDLQTSVFDAIASALTKGDFEEAIRANAEGITKITNLFAEDAPSTVKDFMSMSIQELVDQNLDIIRSQNDHLVAKETELRALSRSSTTRNSGASLDPTSRTLSELQSQLSEA